MLIDFLKQRFTQAEKFTKTEFIDMAEKAIKDYDATEDWVNNTVAITDSVNKRYEFTIPLIFTNTEAIKASSFEKIPEVIFNGRGNDDDEKKKKVEGAYNYIADIVDLDTFMFDTYHWFVLLGFCSGHASFKSEYTTVPILDETTGQPIIDENGEVQTRNKYTYNDPILDAGDPLKEFYSPDSEFSIDASKIPYLFRKKSVTPQEIKKTYGVEVQPDAVIDYEKSSKSKIEKDNKRCTLYYYYGEVSEDVSKEVDAEQKPLFENWEETKQYYIIYAGDKILYVGESENKSCKVGRWYGHPNKFFGYGTGKIGRQFQKEKSIRRGQMIRLADVAAFPKLVINNDGKTKVDINTMLDPRENLVVTYEGDKPPEYMQPGNLAPIVTANSEMADQDAQQAFGIMDLSTGAQNSSTVKTATGQTIFADASQRRVAFAKKRYLKFIKAIIIMLLTLARDNWDEDKLISVTNENGETTNVPITADDLKDIDFEKDISVEFETPSVNKDIIRQQMIALYDKFKDDPLVERTELVKDLLRTGFDIKNPDKYIKKPTVAAGTVLTGEDGTQYTVGKSGEIMSPEDQAVMGSPSNEQAIKNQPQLQ